MRFETINCGQLVIGVDPGVFFPNWEKDYVNSGSRSCGEFANAPSFNLYTAAEIDAQMAPVRSAIQSLQSLQSTVPAELQQFNQEAQSRVAQTVEQALAVQDIDHPTQAQQQMISVIRQIVRQEIQKALQQQ